MELPEKNKNRNLAEALDMKAKEPAVLEDIHLEWHEEGVAHMLIMGEFEDGHEECVGYFIDDEKPRWLLEAENGNEFAFENYDYGDWYDEACEIARDNGYTLSFDLED